MEQFHAVHNKLATACLLLIVCVLTVDGSTGYLTTSILDPNNPPSLLDHDNRLDIPNEDPPQQIALHIPKFSEASTHRPTFRVRKRHRISTSTTTTTTTAWPPIHTPIFIEKVKHIKQRPSGPISTYAFLTYANGPNPSYYPSPNQTTFNPIQVATVGPPTRLYSQEEYLKFKYGRIPMHNFHVPFKSMVKNKETGLQMQPTIMRGLATVRRTMIGVMSSLKSMWHNMLSFMGNTRKLLSIETH